MWRCGTFLARMQVVAIWLSAAAQGAAALAFAGCATTDTIAAGPDLDGTAEVSGPDADAGGPAAHANGSRHWRRAERASCGEVGDAAGWCLPALERACDRVVACNVGRCEGWGWRVAGARHMDCLTGLALATDKQRVVIMAADCAAVVKLTMQFLPQVVSSCATPTCESACGRAAACIVAGCPGIQADRRAGLVVDCLDGCTAPDAPWRYKETCSELIVDKAKYSDTFMSDCLGAGR